MSDTKSKPGTKSKSPAAKTAVKKTAATKVTATALPKKAAPSKSPAAKITPGAKPATRAKSRTLTPGERYLMIAEAAYYIAAKRNFAPGDPTRDWCDAEAQINAMLTVKPSTAAHH